MVFAIVWERRRGGGGFYRCGFCNVGLLFGASVGLSRVLMVISEDVHANILREKIEAVLDGIND